jgi:DHA3 family macrolide efflux protein-like MFS transporter
MEAKAKRPRSTWAPLQNRNFVVLLTGRNLSNWGDALYTIALVWFVYHSTHSVLATAALSAAQRIAVVVAGPVAGVLVDRWDRRRTMIGVDLFHMGVVLVLAVLALRHALGIIPIYGAILLMTAAEMLVGPAFHSVMSRILSPDDLPAGNGLYRSVGSANGFFAQAVGGFIVGALGAVSSLFLDVGSFLFSMAGLSVLRIPPEPSHTAPESGQRRRFVAELREGWAAIRQHPVLPSILLWLFLGTAGGGAVAALIPVVVFQQLHGGPTTLGFAGGAEVLGSVVGGLATAWLSRRVSMTTLLVGCSGLMGFAYAGFGLSPTVWLSLPLLAAGGFGQTVANSAFNAFFQASVPAEVMGRTFGILGAVEGAAGPFSALAGGYLGNQVGAGPVLAVGALWMGLSSLVLVANHSLRAPRRSPGHAP